MQPRAYALMAELEDEHWWYRGRRALVHRLLSRLDPPRNARLLDVGAGSGGNLELLGAFGSVWGVEPSPLGQALGDWRGRLIRGRAGELPFRAASFDVVAALDVLEHLHDELAALDEVRRVLRPAGMLLLHVPAYRWLWGHEDVVSQHRRRYRAGEIRRLLVAGGFAVEHLGYSTTALLPVVAAIKVGKRLFVRGPEPRSDVERLPARPLNRLLAALAEWEADVAATAELPFGASIVAAARKVG